MYTKEEIETGIEEGNAEIINMVLSGTVPTEEVDEVEEEKVTEESVADEVPSLKFEDQAPVDESAKLLEDELAYYKGKYKEASSKPVVNSREIELQKQLDEQRKLAEEALAKSQHTQPEAPTLEITDDDDDDLVDDYSRKNREYLKKLSEMVVVPTGQEDIRAELDKLKAEAVKRAKAEEARVAETTSKEQRRLLFKEVDDFQKANGNFATSAPVSEMFAEVSDFKSRIKDFIRSEDSQEVEKAYYSIISGKTPKDDKLRAEIAKVGIVPPTDINNYMKLAAIVDLKNGLKYNRFSGEYEDITDSSGNKVVQRSIDDAYRLSDYSGDAVAEATIAAAKDVQAKLMNRENSAVVMPNGSTAGSENTRMSSDAINRILDTPNSTLRKNPALAKEYKRALAQLGMS